MKKPRSGRSTPSAPPVEVGSPVDPEREVEDVDTAAQLNKSEDAVLTPGEKPYRPLSRERQAELIEGFKKKFKKWHDFEGDFIRQFNDDVRFTHGDSVNMWQWDQQLVNDRANKPSLTMNVTRIHCYLVTNEFRRNPPSIAVKPTGLGANGESAKTWGGLIREIARSSNASAIYLKQGENMVQGGVGYWRVKAEFENDMSFNQVLRIRNIADPTKCGLDPDRTEPDGSDARWGFVYEDLPNEQVEEEYPRAEDEIGVTNAVTGTLNEQTWVSKDKTRVMEWYEIESYKDELIGFQGNNDQQVRQFRSKIPEELLDQILRDPLTQRRDVLRKRVMWYKIVGDRIVRHYPVPGEYIPIVMVTGEEVVVEGELDRKGMTRNLMDPQRNMNYWISSAAEQVALQTKIPYIGPKRAFENNPQWTNANLENYAYLPYNDWDEENKRAIPAPTRPQQAGMADAYIKGLTLAENYLRDISGQQENTEGKEDNAISGRAINARKAQGLLATYNYPDALAQGVAYTGKIILSAAKEVYDTSRLIRILHPDGKEADVSINPMQSMAQQSVAKEGEEGTDEVMFNPNVGTYDVEVTSGPDYETQRQWAVEAMSQLVAGNEKLWGTVGDLLVKNMDFPGADEMAERLRRTIPPVILGEGPTPSEQQLTGQVQQLQKLLESMVASMAEMQRKLENKDEELTIKAVDAETYRIKEVGNAEANFEAAGLGDLFRQVMGKTIADAAGDPDPSALAEAHDAENDEQPGEEAPEPVPQGGMA